MSKFNKICRSVRSERERFDRSGDGMTTLRYSVIGDSIIISEGLKIVGEVISRREAKLLRSTMKSSHTIAEKYSL
ncbi:hypothetical protein PGB90_009285 [Kerria lacca]